MRRATGPSLLLLTACGLAACGGSTQTRTVTVTKTVTAPASTQAQAPTTSAPTTSTPATSTGAEGAPPAPPLPAGVVAADGTYRMRFRNSDYQGENIVVSEDQPDPADWKFATTCQGSTCTVQMQRLLESGAYKNVTLQQDASRPNVFVGTTTGTAECINNSHAPVKERYSVRLTGPENVNGRQTAARVDAYFTETTRDCPLADFTRGVVSWRGHRL
jgi:hypothetical protein